MVAVVALVAWRGGELHGGWSWALRSTGLLAVVGLLTVVAVAARAALRAHADAPGAAGAGPGAGPGARPSPHEVVVRVPPDGEGTPTVLPAVATAASPVPVHDPAHDLAHDLDHSSKGSPDRLTARLERLLVVAVLTSAPVLVVLVLAFSTGDHTRDGAGPDHRDHQDHHDHRDPQDHVDRVGDAAASPTVPVATPAPTGSGAAPSLPPVPNSLPSPGLPPAPGDACHRVVASGDTLWSIASAQLVARGDTHPSAAAIDTAWRGLYTSNQMAVGPNPDLVQPGLSLNTCP